MSKQLKGRSPRNVMVRVLKAGAFDTLRSEGFEMVKDRRLAGVGVYLHRRFVDGFVHIVEFRFERSGGMGFDLNLGSQRVDGYTHPAMPQFGEISVKTIKSASDCEYFGILRLHPFANRGFFRNYQFNGGFFESVFLSDQRRADRTGKIVERHIPDCLKWFANPCADVGLIVVKGSPDSRVGSATLDPMKDFGDKKYAERYIEEELREI